MNSQHTEDAVIVNDDDGMIIDRSEDAEALQTNQEGWDDLAVLKDELAQTLLSFVIEIERITSSPELLEALGTRRGEFDKTLDVFYSDIDRFTNTIQSLRSEHDHLQGGVTSMDDLNLFTRLSMGYQTLQIELQSLLGPTMANIVLMLHEVSPSKIAVQPLNAQE
jgi:hypothetical protein